MICRKFYEATITLPNKSVKHTYCGYSKEESMDDVREAIERWHFAKFGTKTKKVDCISLSPNLLVANGIPTLLVQAVSMPIKKFVADNGFTPNNFDNKTKLKKNIIVDRYGEHIIGARYLRDTVGMKIVGLRRLDDGKKNGHVEHMLFDDKRSFLRFDEQDPYSYHDCADSARHILVLNDAVLWKNMMEYNGYLEPTWPTF